MLIKTNKSSDTAIKTHSTACSWHASCLCAQRQVACQLQAVEWVFVAVKSSSSSFISSSSSSQSTTVLWCAHSLIIKSTALTLPCQNFNPSLHSHTHKFKSTISFKSWTPCHLYSFHLVHHKFDVFFVSVFHHYVMMLVSFHDYVMMLVSFHHYVMMLVSFHQ